MNKTHYGRLLPMAVLSFISMYALMYAMVDRFANVFMNLNQVYRQNFRALLTGHGNLHYDALDALWINRKDLRLLPLTRRKRPSPALYQRPLLSCLKCPLLRSEVWISSTPPSGWTQGHCDEAKDGFLPARNSVVQDQEPELHAG